MDRLTTRYGAQVGPANGVAVRYMALSPDTNPWIDKAIKHLAAYEDTGMMPDDVAALQTVAKLLESDRDIEREMRLVLEAEVKWLQAELSEAQRYIYGEQEATQ